MENTKIYVMVNKENGAKVECTEKFLPEWFARGFEVDSIRFGELLETESSQDGDKE
ncbi:MULTISPECIES: hypothetical protein [Brevibacillus]|uniref:Uncharacterized protein n=1 Tax=Brevibacillus fulvus TaxID=1125967 RepID=A0A938Y1V1_9BACL|nr:MULTISPECIES: hypothetical protein [Brevibacillus]MBM7591770.1 hypothetical protein [Brevibacillus fulvus]MED1747109.1 hypothetical protein [Brevibacillus borstelensis]